MKVPRIPRESPILPRFSRRHALRMIAGSLVATTAGAAVNAAWIEPDSLSITRRDIPCRRLPPALDGLRVCLLADLHYQDPAKDDPLLERILRAIPLENPDLILMPGDFIDSDAAMAGPLLERLAGLDATHGVFASLGNHDGWNADRDTLVRQFGRRGFGLLVNRNTRLTIRGEALHVAGTDFVWNGRPDPRRTLRGIPSGEPVIAMVHEPDYFDTIIRHRPIDLQVSGHTHGGQCRVPFVGIAPVKVLWGRKYIHGHFHDGKSDGSNLFVTRGVGTTGLRVRFACPPELVVLTLRGDGRAAGQELPARGLTREAPLSKVRVHEQHTVGGHHHGQ